MKKNFLVNTLFMLCFAFLSQNAWCQENVSSTKNEDKNVSEFVAEGEIPIDIIKVVEDFSAQLGIDIKVQNPRYGWKTCHICHGSGVCTTCNGKGYFYGGFGIGEPIPCPNCLIQNGVRTGKCRTCSGKGKVYGLLI